MSEQKIVDTRTIPHFAGVKIEHVEFGRADGRVTLRLIQADGNIHTLIIKDEAFYIVSETLAKP